MPLTFALRRSSGWSFTPVSSRTCRLPSFQRDLFHLVTWCETFVTSMNGVMMGGSVPGGRPGLVAARVRWGWSQAKAAEEVGVSSTTWSRWESGVQAIREGNRRLLAERFYVSREEVDRWADGAESEPLPWQTAGIDQPTLAATLESTDELWRWDLEPSRRRFLMSLPFVPGFLTEWLLSWQLDPAVDTRAHEGKGRAVGLEDVHRVRDVIDKFAMMDHLFGGGYVRPTVVDFLHHQMDPLLRGTYTDEVGSQLLTAAATMTGMAGWEAYDLSLHGLAQGYYGQALKLAKAADDPLTSAWILSVMSQQAIDLHQAGWAVRLARAAYQAGEQAEASPRARAGLLLREARATALSVELSDTPDPHTASRVARLLAEVETTYARAQADDDESEWVSAPWINDLHEPELAAEAGCAWRMIGDYRRAQDCADIALAGFGTGQPRSAQFNQIHRAQALLGMNEVEEAINSARRAVPMASALTSARSVALVSEFDRELTPHTAEPSVREWREYLRAELRIAAA